MARCQWGWLWLAGQSWRCVLSWKKYTASLKKEKNNNNYPLRVSPDRIRAAGVSWLLIGRLLTGNKSMNSRSSWGCEPIRKQRMRHKGHERGKKKKKMRTTPSCPNQQQQKQKKTTFDCYSLRVMQGVVRLTMEVCAPISRLSNKFDKKRGVEGAKNGQLIVIVKLLTCSISLLDTSLLKYLIKWSCSI